MTNNVKVLKSGVWTDQAQQDWCYKSNHARPDRYRSKKCARKNKDNNQHKQTNVESVVSLGYIWPGMEAKANRPGISLQDRSRNPYKSPPTCFWLFLYLSSVAIPAYYTWASLSSSLHIPPSEFASRSYSTPHKREVIASLCHIQHHARWQSLSLCINLTST